MTKPLSKIDSIRGFTIVEIVLACAIFSLVALMFVSTFAYVANVTTQAGRRHRALFLTEEALEAARSIRHQDFNLLLPGVYGVTTTNQMWALTAATNTIGIFSRTLTISTLDDHTKKIVSEVRWTTSRLPSVVSLFTYLTDWPTAIDAAAVSSSTLCQ